MPSWLGCFARKLAPRGHLVGFDPIEGARGGWTRPQPIETAIKKRTLARRIAERRKIVDLMIPQMVVGSICQGGAGRRGCQLAADGPATLSVGDADWAGAAGGGWRVAGAAW